MTPPYLIYMGKSKGSIPGVPARNLTYSEAQQHGERKLIASGLYILLVEPKKRDAEIIKDLLTDETPKKRRSKKELTNE